MIRGGPGYVAVGWENPTGSNTNAVVWTSVDGASWAQLFSSLPQPNAVGAAAWGDQVVVAVGGDESGVVWMSPDAGRRWITADAGGFAAAEGRVTSFGDALFDGSCFIISGSDCDQTEADCHGIIWSSD